MNEIDCLSFFLAIYVGEKYNEYGVKRIIQAAVLRLFS